MTNRILISLVVVLLLGLAVESAYLFKLKTEAKENGNIRISSSSSNSSPFNNRSFYDDIWGDSFFERPFEFGSVWSHDPFNWKEIENLHKDIDRIIQRNFHRSFGQFRLAPDFHKPNLDIKDEGNEYVVKLDMPGFDKNEIKVELKDNFLTVSGERKKDITEEKDGRFYRSERNFGTFKRTIPVPGNLKPDEVIADYKNGVLTIKIPKEIPATSEEDKGVTIDIL